MRADPEDIVAFVEVVKAGSFSAAARRLGVPKSSISRRMQKLERTLSTQLVSRTTRTLNLTEAGRGYYERARRALEELESAERLLEGLLDEPRGTLRVSVPSSMEELTYQIIRRYLELYPNVSLVVHASAAVVDLVRDGYDLALRAGYLEDSTLIARKIGDSTLTLAASPAYLERRGTPGELDDLTQHSCLIFGTHGVESVWRFKGPRGETHIDVSGVLSSNDLDILRRAALGGLGIGLFPELQVRPELEAGSLVQVLPGYCLPSPAFYAVYPATSHLAPTVRAFIDVCTELVPGRFYR